VYEFKIKYYANQITMTYAFIIVVSVAITVKLLFLSFSMYFTLKNKETSEVQVSVHRAIVLRNNAATCVLCDL
jgi:cell division protein FtsX